MVTDAAAPMQAKVGRAAKFEDREADAAPLTEKTSSGPPKPEIRQNFAETAFFAPQLLTDAKGDVTLSFKAPDSVTAWNIWLLAVSKNLASGTLAGEAHSIKELMVRPYLPRFVREGDDFELKILVSNAGKSELKGKLDLDLFDRDTGKSLLQEFGVTTAEQSFRIAAGKDQALSVHLQVPAHIGDVQVRVAATAGSYTDGELRPLPVLPSRLHLTQSRFTVLKDQSHKTLTFADMTTTDASRSNDRLNVQVEGQLFNGVLNALPYLVTYPYESAEQIVNRYVSTTIVGSVMHDFPAVATLAKTLAKRPTRLPPWNQTDPSRRISLEESPWLDEARGGKDEHGTLLRILDPAIAQDERRLTLGKIRQMQLPDGSFPWFAGGPASDYMTLYLMEGLAKAAEFSGDVPKDLVQKGWDYLGHHLREEVLPRLLADKCCTEYATFLNYVASSYPDPSWVNGAIKPQERQQLLDLSFQHWRELSPYVKAYLALTLKRAGRLADAKLVFASIMDSAKSSPDLGVYWAPEERAWLWYNDQIESHAFVLRALTEIEPTDPKRDGLALWLLLNRKLNHWKSTKATAEVIYSLVHYLKQEHALGSAQTATVRLGSLVKSFTFKADDPVATAGVDVPSAKIETDKMSSIVIESGGKGTMFASANWTFATDALPTAGNSDFFSVDRHFFRREIKGTQAVLSPLTTGAKLKIGDEVEVQLSLRTKHEAEYVHLRDPRGAGFEPVSQVSAYRFESGLGYFEEIRDSGANDFIERLPVGEYTLKYHLRATTAGSFRIGPATLESLYAPEFGAYSAGIQLQIEP